ncbi:MAG: M23 family metallopeptidase [Oscillospiraceae bacterium]|nr:M23 family metallopeptidase [Oscillospiraceae bacterium]
MSNKKFGTGINGKGYYIALILCAVAIGISGYLYYHNANDQTQPGEPDALVGATVDPTLPTGNAGATQPTQTDGQTEPTTQPTTAVTRKKIRTASPVAGETVAVYAMESLAYNQTTRDWRVHNGVDIAADSGTQVCAAADGTVYTVYEDDTMGMTVVIRHEDGYVTQYSSLGAEVPVKPGDTVTMGQPIGCVGRTALVETATGDHVHFSVTWNDQLMDPAEFLTQS